MTNRRTLFAIACLGMLAFGIVLTTLGAVLPSVIDQAGGPTFGDVRDADQRLERMVDAARRREGDMAAQAADRRPPGSSA